MSKKQPITDREFRLSVSYFLARDAVIALQQDVIQADDLVTVTARCKGKAAGQRIALVKLKELSNKARLAVSKHIRANRILIERMDARRASD